MAVIEINKDPSKRELLWFGAMLLAFLGIVGGVVWRGGDRETAQVIWGVGVATTAGYYAIPGLRRPIYLGWLYAAFPIGWVISHLVMGIIYFLVITPIALVFKLIRRDALQRRIDRGAKSYWVEHRTGGDPQRYFKQF